MAVTSPAADPQKRLVDRMRARLESGYWPRVHCMFIVGLSTAAAFLTSFVLMFAHVRWMAVRYGVAAIAGYATFLCLLSAWVRWRWSRAQLNASGDDIMDVGNNLDIPVPSFSGSGGSGPGFVGGGGRSGGGGASGSWGSPVSSSGGGGGKGGGGLDLDGDDLFWLIVVVVAAFGGAIAIGYVIYIAPTLLAEAIVNGAVAGKVYHGMQKQDHEFWTEEIFTRTILSGVVVIVCATVAGYAFNKIAPEAISIGGVFAHLNLTR
jgi:cytochrome b subunit of formate dehydrogenase